MKIRQAIDAYNREQEPYIVAYLDILGVTSRIKGNSIMQVNALNTIYNLFTAIFELADSQKGIKSYSGIQFKAFSDNIIIAKKLTKNKVDDVEALLNCVSNFMCSAVGEGVCWLVRGGITIDDFYIDDTVVWGPALVRAYEMENDEARFPRILLDVPIVNLFENSRIDNDYLCIDSDGKPFLNYMSIWHFAGRSVFEAFEIMKSEAQLSDGSYPESIFQKLNWHMQYINSQLEKKDEKGEKKFRLSI